VVKLFLIIRVDLISMTTIAGYELEPRAADRRCDLQKVHPSLEMRRWKTRITIPLRAARRTDELGEVKA
jgi:hypothetical protein